MNTNEFPSAERSRLRRHPERGSRHREDIYAILDEALVCHVGLVFEGRPLVIPMAYGRDGDRLLLHGGTTSRLLKHLAGGAEACVTVTLIDGVVLARSTFHSSYNYRSVVAFGRTRRLESDSERGAALDLIVEHIAPGRSGEAREPTLAELATTEVVEFVMDEASAKTRSGPPKEPQTDVSVPVWAGEIPLVLTPGLPVAAPDLDPRHGASDVVSGWRRGVTRVQA